MYLNFFFFDSVQLYILVYVRYMSLDVFPMYFSCIRSLHYLKDISGNLDSSQLYVGGYTIFFQGLHLTICLLRLHLSTPLRCNEMRLAGNLLSFCALYGHRRQRRQGYDNTLTFSSKTAELKIRTVPYDYHELLTEPFTQEYQFYNKSE